MDNTADETQGRATEFRARVYGRAQEGPWVIEMWYELDGEGGPTELRITAAPDADPQDLKRGITTGTLRSIPLAQLSKEIAPKIEEARQEHGVASSVVGTLNKLTAYIAATVEADPKPGRKGRPAKFHAAVATVYAWFADRRNPNPVQMLADATGTDRRAAANWVSAARRHGMLTEASERASGGKPTPKALRALIDKEN